MNPEQLDLARRLAAHPRFEWREGMAACEDAPSGNWQPGDYWWRILSGAPDVAAVTSEGDMHEVPYMPSAFARAYPDLTDDATGGVLWEMAGKPAIHVARPVGEPEEVRARPHSFPLNTWLVGATLAEACARALLAEWGEA